MDADRDDPEDAALSAEAREFLRVTRPAELRLLAWSARRQVRRLLPGPAPLLAGGVPVARVGPASADRMVYLHGGAFVMGVAMDSLGARLGEVAGMECFGVGYALAPEARFPRALRQCVAAWDALAPEAPGRRVLAAISAGGNLALGLLATLLERQRRGESATLPDVVVLLTPWADLSADGASLVDNDGRDPVLRWRGQVDKAARAYAGRADVRDPFVSPIHQDWTGLTSRVLVTTGTRDLLFSECERLAEAMAAAGVPVTLDVAPEMWHGYQAHGLPESDASLRRIGEFVRA